MKYHLVSTSKARRQILRLDAIAMERVTKAISGLSDNPRPVGCLKMTASDLYRIRVGDYRVIYEVHDRTITVVVVKIAHRRDAYR